MAAGRTGVRTADFLVDLMANIPAAGTPPERDATEEGQTLPSRHGHPVPRLPHERDESSDSHPGTGDDRVAQAARDLADGQKDTGLAPVVTQLSREAFPSDKAKKIRP